MSDYDVNAPEIDPEGVSPWWPCPECSAIHFQPASCVFERGGWIGSDMGWMPFTPPSGHPSAVATQVRCINCGHEFDIARHYGWPVAGNFS